MRGFARVSVAVPALEVAALDHNLKHTLELWKKADAQGDALVVFPELGLCGYTLRDLLLDHHLLQACERSLMSLVEASENLSTMAVVGLPLRVGGGIYNVAAAIASGKLLGVVPKSYLPNYREFEETRWFRPGVEVEPGSECVVGPHRVPFGTDLLFRSETQPDLVVGLEICEDYWVQQPPSVAQVSAGATVVANLSASNFTIGKAELRRLLARSASDRGKCAYLYVAAGPGESSTDLAFDADAFICENGALLAESKRFSRESQLCTVDVDLELLLRERISTNTFGDCSQQSKRAFRIESFSSPDPVGKLRRQVPRHPFIPSDPQTLARRCWEIFEIQSNALATRMRAIGRPKLILGVSGGLDSTQAALVAVGALDLLGQPRSDLLCATLPGLGTSAGTRDNAQVLAESLGARFEQIGVEQASHLLLQQTQHPAAVDTVDVAGLLQRLQEAPELGDVTLENVQARLRTLVLMTLANREGGLLVGTGDLSEKALGWSTYAGDHIAMYDVNAGVPKTLIQFVIRWVANERASSWSEGDAETLRKTLFSILDTPISPELLPATAEGEIAQLTEEKLGPYELHDFFLYNFVRRGARPGRILDLAQIAFDGDYDLPTLKRWLSAFFTRFFRNQFKRSCTADAPKVGMVALSPRGDWRMPSDARVQSWLDEIERY